MAATAKKKLQHGLCRSAETSLDWRAWSEWRYVAKVHGHQQRLAFLAALVVSRSFVALRI